MSGWEDWIFGNLPPTPARPTSRAAMPGLQPYQQMPDPKYSVTDERGQTDQAYWMKNYTDPSNKGKYQPSFSGSGNTGPTMSMSDPMLDAGPTLSQGVSDPDTYDYKTSFKPNWRPSPYNRPAPYNPFGGMGPNLPRGPQGTSVDPEMPYMGAHLPISPGDPGWTPPPSQSGPHNPQGDPDRPGYGSTAAPMDASQPSYQQLINFLQSRGGTS